MRTTIKAKFIRLSVLIILPMFALMIFFVVNALDQYNLVNVKKTVLNDSYLLQVYLNQYFVENNWEDQDERAIYFLNSDLSKMVGLRSQFFFDRGLIYVDSVKEAAAKDRVFFLQDEGVGLALKNSKNFIVKRFNGRRFFRMNFPVYFHLKRVGVIRLEYPLHEEDQFKKSLIMLLTLVSVLIFSLFLWLLNIFTHRVVSPLTGLKQGVQQFADGQLQEAVSIESGDEVEELADAFNAMAGKINQLIDSLQKEKTKQQDFFNNMTHEIRTPLTTIIGYADIIDKLENKADRADCLGYIQSEGQRLLRMVDSIFRSSKLNTYTLTLNKSLCQLEEVLRETVEIIRYKANKYGIVINTDSRNPGIVIQADKDKLKEVFLNLLDNAILHSKSPQIDILLDYTENEACLEVKDYGQGIDSVQLERIHQKLSGSVIHSTYDQAGHGYGLSVSKSILEAHGGSLEIESSELTGTVVRVKLPIGNEG